MFKVISGAQTGADVAALWAAKLFKIPTGGLVPKGFRTLDGAHPEAADTFGVTEHCDFGYRERTIENLRSADFTLVCSEVLSPGTRLTINQCQKRQLPLQVCRLGSSLEQSLQSADLSALISKYEQTKLLGLDFTLNVAGNSSKNSARAFEFTFKLCYCLFTELGYTSTVRVTDWNNYKDRWK